MSIADKLNEVANNVHLVYDAGYDRGYAAGLEEGSSLGGATNTLYINLTTAPTSSDGVDGDVWITRGNVV